MITHAAGGADRVVRRRGGVGGAEGRVGSWEAWSNAFPMIVKSPRRIVLHLRREATVTRRVAESPRLQLQRRRLGNQLRVLLPGV